MSGDGLMHIARAQQLLLLRKVFPLIPPHMPVAPHTSTQSPPLSDSNKLSSSLALSNSMCFCYYCVFEYNATARRRVSPKYLLLLCLDEADVFRREGFDFFALSGVFGPT